MKALIKKVLRESTEEILKYRKLFSDFEIPEQLKGNPDGGTNVDDFFWTIVDMIDYKSDNDYRRINQLFKDLNSFAGVPAEKILLLSKVLNFKTKALDNKWGDEVTGVSDDSWSDLKCDIVSRGKEFYNNAMNDLNIVQRMSDDFDYKESFSYAFPYRDDLI